MNYTNLSKFISLILRHKPEVINVKMDEYGYVNVDDLINGILEHSNFYIDFDVLKEIVYTDNKQRYSFANDYNKIRANQGHSIPVNLNLENKCPPNSLYHGTGVKYLKNILKEGLKPKSRMYVHLSDNYNTALEVGARHGEPCVIYIDAFKMYNDGYKFYLSENGVWLTNVVPKKYILTNEK